MGLSVQWLGIRSDDDAKFPFVFPALVEQGQDIRSQGFGHLGRERTDQVEVAVKVSPVPSHHKLSIIAVQPLVEVTNPLTHRRLGVQYRA